MLKRKLGEHITPREVAKDLKAILTDSLTDEEAALRVWALSVRYAHIDSNVTAPPKWYIPRTKEQWITYFRTLDRSFRNDSLPYVEAMMLEHVTENRTNMASQNRLNRILQSPILDVKL